MGVVELKAALRSKYVKPETQEAQWTANVLKEVCPRRSLVSFRNPMTKKLLVLKPLFLY